METINLGNHRSSGAKVFSGRPSGEEIRKKFDLDKFDKTAEAIEFIVPPDTLTISSSYFLGLFGISIRQLGEQRFREKYIFKSESRLIHEDIERGIQDALNELD